MTNDDKYEKVRADREKFVKAILESSDPKKIVVAGPGTGKTYLFKQLFLHKPGDNIALTFINNLANDLKAELRDVGKANTFHGFCKRLLHKYPVGGIDGKFFYYPKLIRLIESDANIFELNLNNFDEAFYNMIEDERIEFFLERGNYYNAVSYNDSVYRVLKAFYSKEILIPEFTQIVVDEFQDFCRLEVSFIKELAKKSDILIAGDDDQALYSFKHATANFLRKVYSDSQFYRFELPYCNRCTEVIVKAVNDVLNVAGNSQKLIGRIKKNFLYFFPDKERDSKANPKIIHVNCSTNTKKAPYIAKFIEQEITRVPKEKIVEAKSKGFPCILIIGPSHYTRQVYNYLEKDFNNISYRKKDLPELEVLDGYSLLLDDRNSNLGWRILIEGFALEGASEIILQTKDCSKNLFEILPDAFREKHLQITDLLNKIINSVDLTKEEEKELTTILGLSTEEILGFFSTQEDEESEEESSDEISIKITTIIGAKGLSAHYVFLIGFNDSILPRNPEDFSDDEICQFIVGLTRARTKCYLISNLRFGAESRIKPSSFLKWVNPERIENVFANKEYFDR